MNDEDRTCPSCGARVPAEADRCDLCGTSVAEVEDTPDEPGEASSETEGTTATGEEATPDPTEETGEGPSVFCNQCGWENPPGARYCSRCGEELQDLSDASTANTRRVSADLPTGPTATEEESSRTEEQPSGEREEAQAAMGRQIVRVVGGALVLVLILFFVTQWSNQYEWGSGASESPTAQAEPSGGAPAAGRSPSSQQPRETTGVQERGASPTDLQALLDQTADSLTGAVATQIDSLQTRIDQASDGEKRKLQAELVSLYIGTGHPGRAAVVQKDLAEATGAVEAQRRAADLLYRWMQKLQGQGQRQQVFQVARHAAQAYQTVADQRPDDLDARTRMGEAYLLTNKPMKGIQTINAVLDDDSTFVPARFQKGLALLQINRLDQATKQFELVKQYAEDGSPFYQQADQALKVIREQRSSGSPGNAPAPADDGS